MRLVFLSAQTPERPTRSKHPRFHETNASPRPCELATRFSRAGGRLGVRAVLSANSATIEQAPRQQIRAPLNIRSANAPTLKELAALGVRRVTFGSAPMRADVGPGAAMGCEWKEKGDLRNAGGVRDSVR